MLRSLVVLVTFTAAVRAQVSREPAELVGDGPQLVAQNPPAGQAPPRGGFESRTQEIAAAREAKSRSLRPEVVSGTEHVLLEIRERRIIEKLQYGWHGLRPRVGGLVTGGGFAFGAEYRNDELADSEVLFRTSARMTWRGFQHYDMELALPSVAGGHVSTNLLAVHRNYPQMQYYGPGPNSQKTGRSDYRLEDTLYQSEFGVRPVRPLVLGVSAGFLQVNVGPGTHRRWISAERIYGPAQAPGIDRQTDFARGSAFVQLDYRDVPGGPRSGGFYRAQFTYNKDVDLKRHTFRRLDAEAQQYISLFNQRRVIALRARTALTYANTGQVVPFYMQPTLGGSEELRGFRPFRFYDDNMVVYTAEYRYEVFSGLDMAVFGDAGKVFQRRGDLNFRDVEASYGIGMRFNARNNVFLRIDTGFSHEGFQVWFKFGNVF
ncbi:MAG TPA: BamA/TamA family outer membrane protein [Bryobacteraceae bacterium]|nr:BamA/TamA family outer membrane protein [Bryobacteraceae bacterium]